MKFWNTTMFLSRGFIVICAKGRLNTCGNLGAEMNWIEIKHINKPSYFPLPECELQAFGYFHFPTRTLEPVWYRLNACTCLRVFTLVIRERRVGWLCTELPAFSGQFLPCRCVLHRIQIACFPTIPCLYLVVTYNLSLYLIGCLPFRVKHTPFILEKNGTENDGNSGLDKQLKISALCLSENKVLALKNGFGLSTGNVLNL